MRQRAMLIVFQRRYMTIEYEQFMYSIKIPLLLKRHSNIKTLQNCEYLNYLYVYVRRKVGHTKFSYY